MKAQSNLPRGSRKAKVSRPPKPYPDFPLTPHASGKWMKNILGVVETGTQLVMRE